LFLQNQAEIAVTDQAPAVGNQVCVTCLSHWNVGDHLADVLQIDSRAKDADDIAGEALDRHGLKPHKLSLW